MKTLAHIVSEHVKQNSRRIWGYFILSDGSKSHFEQTKADLTRLGSGSWFQWGNTTENLYLSVERVEELVAEWKKTI